MSIQEAYESKRPTSINPFGYFIAVIKERPDAGKQKHIAAFKKLVLGEDGLGDYAEAIVDEWCSLRYSTALEAAVPPTKEQIEQKAKERSERRQAETARKQAETAAAIETADKIKKNIAEMTLAYVMPNGSALGESTFGYCGEVGDLFADIARLGKPDQIVGKVITAKQLAAFKASKRK